MIKLSDIIDNKGARAPKKRLGRGIGSGLGKTSGRGGKGQTARSGVSINGFEGGQTPIYRRLPKRGFVNIHAQPVFELTFLKLSRSIYSGKINPAQVIDRDVLIASGLMKKWQTIISFISKGEPISNLNLEVTRFSKKAKDLLEKTGSKVLFV